MAQMASGRNGSSTQRIKIQTACDFDIRAGGTWIGTLAKMESQGGKEEITGTTQEEKIICLLERKFQTPARCLHHNRIHSQP
jgi:hypothetical protein